MMRLCLIRHGQTDWNVEGRYQGQSDVPLNETGRAQAACLAAQLQAERFSAVYTSDLQRAAETARILASPQGLPVHTDMRLREINQGEWEGQLVGVIQTRYEALWKMRSANPGSVRPPGGETVEEVSRRVCAALDELAERHPGGRVLVVSHGISIAVAICRAHSMPISQAYNHIPGNTVPIWLDWPPAPN
ncbi:MAG: histidine phosphatase family protein [Anaerolineae bacterium]|nr:histidine phosphatase family protein [Anaerolineae bacterium]